MVVWCTHNVRQDGSSFTWHQPCNPPNSAVNAPLGGYSKRAMKRIQWLLQNRMRQERGESARGQRIALESPFEVLRDHLELKCTTSIHIKRKLKWSSVLTTWMGARLCAHPEMSPRSYCVQTLQKNSSVETMNRGPPYIYMWKNHMYTPFKDPVVHVRVWCIMETAK